MGSTRFDALSVPATDPQTSYGSSSVSLQQAAALLRATASRFGLPLSAADPFDATVAVVCAHVYSAVLNAPLTSPARHGRAAVGLAARVLQLAAGGSRRSVPDAELLDELLVEYESFVPVPDALVDSTVSLLLGLCAENRLDPQAVAACVCIELLSAAPNSVFAALAGRLSDLAQQMDAVTAG